MPSNPYHLTGDIDYRTLVWINVDPICRYIPTEGAFPAVVAFKSGMQIIGHTPDEIGEAVFDIPDLCILRTENNNEIFAIEPAKAE